MRVQGWAFPHRHSEIAVLWPRRGHCEASGTDSAQRLYVRAAGAGSPMAKGLLAEHRERFAQGSDNPAAAARCRGNVPAHGGGPRTEVAQVAFTGCRFPPPIGLDDSKGCLNHGRGLCFDGVRACRCWRICRLAGRGRAQRASVPGTRLAPPPASKADGPSYASPAEQHSSDLSAWTPPQQDRSLRVRRSSRATPSPRRPLPPLPQPRAGTLQDRLAVLPARVDMPRASDEPTAGMHAGVHRLLVCECSSASSCGLF
jgi:hypothetical protein